MCFLCHTALSGSFEKVAHGWLGNTPNSNPYFSFAGKHYFATSKDVIGLHLPGLLMCVEEVPAVNAKMGQATGGDTILFH